MWEKKESERKEIIQKEKMEAQRKQQMKMKKCERMELEVSEWKFLAGRGKKRRSVDHDVRKSSLNLRQLDLVVVSSIVI